MASETTPSQETANREKLEKKLALFQAILEATRQELLLVELEGLTPILQRKEALIGEITRIDVELEGAANLAQDDPLAGEMGEVVRAILENESTLEARIGDERSRLRKEMRELERQTKFKEYLERQKTVESRIDLKK